MVLEILGRDVLHGQLLSEAKQQVEQYPQYDGKYWGRFDRLVQFKRNMRTKMGLAFERGEYAIADFSENMFSLDRFGNQFIVCWSLRNRVSTSVPVKAVKEVL